MRKMVSKAYLCLMWGKLRLKTMSNGLILINPRWDTQTMPGTPGCGSTCSSESGKVNPNQAFWMCSSLQAIRCLQLWERGFIFTEDVLSQIPVQDPKGRQISWWECLPDQRAKQGEVLVLPTLSQHLIPLHLQWTLTHLDSKVSLCLSLAITKPKAHDSSRHFGILVLCGAVLSVTTSQYPKEPVSESVLVRTI